MSLVKEYGVTQLPNLETERLVLRKRTLDDAEDIFNTVKLPEVAYSAGMMPVQSLEEEITFLTEIYPKNLKDKNLPSGYGIALKSNNRVIGSIGFTHRHEDDVWEIGYLLHPDYWGKGIMPEAARALIDYAFQELGLHKIELGCFSTNPQSQAVAQKLGFTQEACIRDRRNAKGERCDDLRYGLLRSEWEEIRLKQVSYITVFLSSFWDTRMSSMVII